MKKKFEIGNKVLFYHVDFEDEVEGIVTKLYNNGIIAIAFIHPIHGYQLLGLHTSALRRTIDKYQDEDIITICPIHLQTINPEICCNCTYLICDNNDDIDNTASNTYWCDIIDRFLNEQFDEVEEL
jgi:hypothetical protein